MAYLPWSNEYSVNVREIDEQHMRLVHMINTLHESLLSNQGREAQARIIREMVDYAVVHFGTEEKYMDWFSYPDHLPHKAEHELFARKAADLKRRVDEHGFILTLEILNFLKTWLREHILVTDKSYSAHFNSCGLH